MGRPGQCAWDSARVRRTGAPAGAERGELQSLAAAAVVLAVGPTIGHHRIAQEKGLSPCVAAPWRVLGGPGTNSGRDGAHNCPKVCDNGFWPFIIQLVLTK